MKIDRLIGILSFTITKGDRNDSLTGQAVRKSRPAQSAGNIETLCRAGIPIMTRQGMNGGLSIMEDYKIDRHC